MVYHVWRLEPKRRRQYTLISTKRISRWDPSLEPAIWGSRAGANSWAQAQPWPTMVLTCEGEKCGMGACKGGLT